MTTWGNTWTDNKMFKLQEEKRRQQAVVKKFIADHPEYDHNNDDNNRALVDFLEASQKPFNTETIEWAYKELQYLLKPKKKSFFPKISTSLNNNSTSTIPVPTTAISKSEWQKKFDYKMDYVLGQAIQIFHPPDKKVDETPAIMYDKDIAPTTTVRRIKDDTD